MRIGIFRGFAMGARGARLTAAAVILTGAMIMSSGCGEEPAEPVDAEGQMAPTETPVLQTGVRPEETETEDAPATQAPDAAPEPSDLRIEVVKPRRIQRYTLPLVASDNYAMWGWVEQAEMLTPHDLYNYALEKAVPFATRHYPREEPVGYVAGTIPGYVRPFDRFEVTGCTVADDVVVFKVKSVRLSEGYGLTSAARAYYAILASALPPGTKALEIRFEETSLVAYAEDSVLREDDQPGYVYYREGTLRVPIEEIRCDNYFIKHPEYSGEPKPQNDG